MLAWILALLRTIPIPPQPALVPLSRRQLRRRIIDL